MYKDDEKFAVWSHENENWERRVALHMSFQNGPLEPQTLDQVEEWLQKMIIENRFLSHIQKMKSVAMGDSYRISFASKLPGMLMYLDFRDGLYYVGLQIRVGWTPHDLAVCQNLTLAGSILQCLMVSVLDDYEGWISIDFYEDFVESLSEWSFCP